MRERDYFRAISVYKELAFFSRNRDSTVFYLTQIGKAYRKSRKYELSIDAYSSIPGRFPLSSGLSNSININLGLNYLGLSVPSQALPYFSKVIDRDSTGLARFYAGMAECELGDWERATELYSGVIRMNSDTLLTRCSMDILTRVSRAQDLPHRNPFVAGLLSTVIPGSGQLYCHHYVDAIQSFAFVSSLSFAAYGMYRYDQTRGSGYVLTGISIAVAAMFHFANILGAERTALYFNERQREVLLEGIRQKSAEADEY